MLGAGAITREREGGERRNQSACEGLPVPSIYRAFVDYARVRRIWAAVTGRGTHTVESDHVQLCAARLGEGEDCTSAWNANQRRNTEAGEAGFLRCSGRRSVRVTLQFPCMPRGKYRPSVS